MINTHALNPDRTIKETSDIMGESGLKVLRTILAGERNPEGLLQLCHITARKIAVYYYNLMTRGLSFVEEGLKRYEERYKEHQLKSLQKRAKEMGLQLVAA